MRRSSTVTPLTALTLALILSVGAEARGEVLAEEPAPEELQPLSSPRSTAPSVALGAYVEAFYQWNFNDPSNGILRRSREMTRVCSREWTRRDDRIRGVGRRVTMRGDVREASVLDMPTMVLA